MDDFNDKMARALREAADKPTPKALMTAARMIARGAATSNLSCKLIVIQYGWVLVGMYYELPDGRRRCTHCAVIRRWGTSDGLGEIALGGPTGSTILDAQPPSTWNDDAEVFVIEANIAKWAPYLLDHPDEQDEEASLRAWARYLSKEDFAALEAAGYTFS